jgi:hypothetical protein
MFYDILEKYIHLFMHSWRDTHINGKTNIVNELNSRLDIHRLAQITFPLDTSDVPKSTYDVGECMHVFNPLLNLWQTNIHAITFKLSHLLKNQLKSKGCSPDVQCGNL